MGTWQPLCISCRKTPWGHEGWREFHSESLSPGMVILRNLAGEKRIDYKVSLRRLFERAIHCSWCRILRDNLQPAGDRYRAHPRHSKELNISIRFKSPKHKGSKKITVLKVTCSGSTEFLELKLHLGVFASSESLENVFPLPVLPPRGCWGFDDKLARTWLAVSGSSESCDPVQARRLLPTRVLAISQNNGKLRVNLRSTEPNETGHFACLSYAWGNLLDTEGLYVELAQSAYNKGLDLESLPPTIQDAVKVTRALELEYLWVDGLCIWQNNLEDKRKELSNLHGYYRNAAIVIQSSGTRSVAEGFLGDKRAHPIACKLQSIGSSNIRIAEQANCSRLKNDRQQTLHHESTPRASKQSLIQDIFNRIVSTKAPLFYVNFELGLFQLPFISDRGATDTFYVCKEDCTDWYDENTQPAATRAWILQEQLLARRILIFPSTGGMIFRNNENKSFGEDQTDSNVIYSDYSSHPLRLPSEVVMTEGQINMYRIRYFSSRPFRVLVDQLRNLWESGRCGSYISDGRAWAELKDSPIIPPNAHKIMSDARREGQILIPVVTRAHPVTISSYQLRCITQGGERLIFTKAPPGYVIPEYLNAAWTDIVNDYCGRHLSNPKDKLPAIAALAREFNRRYADHVGEYRCGIWEKFIIPGLMWTGRSDRSRSAENNIPTWSWAAVDHANFHREVSFHEHGREEKVKILESAHQPELSELRYETVATAFIRLNGRVRECDWYVYTPSFSPQLKLTGIDFHDAELDEILPKCIVLPDCPESVPERGREKVTLLIVTTNGEGGAERINGLLLRALAPDTYTRVGFFTMILGYRGDSDVWFYKYKKRSQYQPGEPQNESVDELSHKVEEKFTLRTIVLR